MAEFYETVYTYTVPDPTVRLYLPPDDVCEYISSNWTHIRLLSERSISDDGLTFKSRMVWSSQEDHAAFKADPFLQDFWNDRKKYNADNGITATLETRIIETID